MHKAHRRGLRPAIRAIGGDGEIDGLVQNFQDEFACCLLHVRSSGKKSLAAILRDEAEQALILINHAALQDHHRI